MFRLLSICAGAYALSAPEDSLARDDECSDASCSVNALQSKVSLRSEQTCKNAVPGDVCYKNIMWAKQTGIRQHPSWYPGLTASSSNAAFQEIVHSHSPDKCALPCANTVGCHTAVKGESCYNDIQWAKHTGIRQHSHWYPGLSPSSSDAEFQASIHQKRPDKCPEPCMEPAAEAPASEPEVPEPAAPATAEKPAPAEEPIIPPQTPSLVPPPEIEEPEETPEEPLPGVIPMPEDLKPGNEPQIIIPVTEKPAEQPAAQPSPPPRHESHPEPEPDINRYPQCPREPQSAREACEQQAIQQEQREREERERQEREEEKEHERNTPLDVRHQEIIDEIGGEPSVGGIPEFDDPDR